jgi:hypothetical protein
VAFRRIGSRQSSCIFTLRIASGAAAKRRDFNLDEHPWIQKLGADHRGSGAHVAKVPAQYRPAPGKVISDRQDVVDADDVGQ